jgi:hypothetical protein
MKRRRRKSMTNLLVTLVLAHLKLRRVSTRSLRRRVALPTRGPSLGVLL